MIYIMEINHQRFELENYDHQNYGSTNAKLNIN
jgi:hypothetical protein